MKIKINMKKLTLKILDTSLETKMSQSREVVVMLSGLFLTVWWFDDKIIAAYVKDLLNLHHLVCRIWMLNTWSKTRVW